MLNKKFSNTDIVLIDIIGFSHNTSKEQLEIITYLTKSYSKVIRMLLNNSQMSFSKMLEGIVPTGDGFYCILNPRLKGYGLILALNFVFFSEHMVQRNKKLRGIRAAVHTGEVAPFTDILGHKNFIGDGLNDCSRYMQMRNASPGAVIASLNAFESFENFLHMHPDFEELMHEQELKRSSLQEFEDKHGRIRASYLVWLRHWSIINPPNINFNSLLA